MVASDFDVAKWMDKAQEIAIRFAGWDDDEFRSAANMALLDAMRAFDPNRGVKFGTYLSHAVKNAVKRVMSQHCERQGAYHLNSELKQRVNFDELFTDPGCAVEVEETVARLPLKLRDVTLLRYREKMTVDEVAVQLGLSRWQVLRRLAKVRQRLYPELCDLAGLDIEEGDLSHVA
jgi:RNA polymerase sigma factor (sigma-70 family)